MKYEEAQTRLEGGYPIIDAVEEIRRNSRRWTPQKSKSRHNLPKKHGRPK